MKELIDQLTEEYRELLAKNYKFQMGDDDFEPTTEEYAIIEALSVIIDDLKKRGY